MAKIQLKGFLVNIGQLEEVGANKTIKQSVILKVPGYVDSFGDKKGNDEYWQIDMLNDAIDKFNIQERHKNAKVKADVYVNSNWWENKTTGKSGCVVNVRMAAIEFVDGAKLANTNPANSVSPDPADDDLPF